MSAEQSSVSTTSVKSPRLSGRPAIRRSKAAAASPRRQSDHPGRRAIDTAAAANQRVPRRPV